MCLTFYSFQFVSVNGVTSSQWGVAKISFILVFLEKFYGSLHMRG